MRLMHHSYRAFFREHRFQKLSLVVQLENERESETVEVPVFALTTPLPIRMKLHFLMTRRETT